MGVAYATRTHTAGAPLADVRDVIGRRGFEILRPCGERGRLFRHVVVPVIVARLNAAEPVRLDLRPHVFGYAHARQRVSAVRRMSRNWNGSRTMRCAFGCASSAAAISRLQRRSGFPGAAARVPCVENSHALFCRSPRGKAALDNGQRPPRAAAAYARAVARACPSDRAAAASWRADQRRRRLRAPVAPAVARRAIAATAARRAPASRAPP